MRPTRRTIVGISVLLAVLLSAGCLDRLQSSLSDWRGEPEIPPPYEASYEEFVTPNHEKTFEVPVTDGARSLVVNAELVTASGGAPEPPFSPAQVTLTVKDPNGQVVDEAKTLSPQSKSVDVSATGFTTFGTYSVNMKGNGLAGGPGGQTYGAKYVLTLRVSYDGSDAP